VDSQGPNDQNYFFITYDILSKIQFNIFLFHYIIVRVKLMNNTVHTMVTKILDECINLAGNIIIRHCKNLLTEGKSLSCITDNQY